MKLIFRDGEENYQIIEEFQARENSIFKDQYVVADKVFNDRKVRAVWDEGNNKYWLSVLNLIAAINEQEGYQKARNYWKNLKIKLKRENNELISATNQFKK